METDEAGSRSGGSFLPGFFFQSLPTTNPSTYAEAFSATCRSLAEASKNSSSSSSSLVAKRFQPRRHGSGPADAAGLLAGGTFISANLLCSSFDSRIARKSALPLLCSSPGTNAGGGWRWNVAVKKIENGIIACKLVGGKWRWIVKNKKVERQRNMQNEKSGGNRGWMPGTYRRESREMVNMHLADSFAGAKIAWIMTHFPASTRPKGNQLTSSGLPTTNVSVIDTLPESGCSFSMNETFDRMIVDQKPIDREQFPWVLLERRMTTFPDHARDIFIHSHTLLPTTSGSHSNVYMIKDLITMRSKDESRLRHSISVSKQLAQTSSQMIMFISLGLLCVEEDKDDRPVRLKLPDHPKLLRAVDA
nr:hypothetical protein Iba_chr02dCG2660 [Ipomoea batatas]